MVDTLDALPENEVALTQPVRILMVTPHAPGLGAGAPIVTLGRIDALTRLGFEVSVLRDHKAGIDPLALSGRAAIVPRSYTVSHQSREQDPPPSRWWRGFDRFVTKGYLPKWNKATWRALHSAVELLTPECVFLDDVRMAEYGRLLRERGYRGRIVLHHHNVEHSLLRRQLEQTRSPGKRLELAYRIRRFWIIESELARCCDASIVLTDLDLATLEKLNPAHPVRFVPHAVDLERYRSTSPVPASKELLFIGSCTWAANRDGLEWFVREIWPAVRAAVPEVKLTVVGRSPPSWVGETEGITTLGFVEDDRPYYERAQAVIVPLRFGGGVRIKILNALAMTRPVVSTALGAEGIPVVAGESIVLGDTPEAFARGTIRLLEGTGYARAIAERGHEVCQGVFSPAAVDQALKEAILGARPPSQHAQDPLAASK